MPGIPYAIRAPLKQALLTCNQFLNPSILHAFFSSTAELKAFYAGLPQANDASAQVDLTLGYLVDQYFVTGENALVIFLRLLSQEYDPSLQQFEDLRKLAYELEKVMKLPPSQLTGASPVDFVIITALEEERDALLNKLPGYQLLSPSQEDIRQYYKVNLPVTFLDERTGEYSIIVISLLNMGRVQASLATSDAIRRWHPRYVLLLGIAGGVAARRVKLGDVLISDQIADYELQKLTPKEPEVRWTVHQADPRLLGAAQNFAHHEWLQQTTVERPGEGSAECHIGTVASGDKVIAFGDALTKYRDTWPKLIGVEMEAGGVAAAAFQTPNPPGFFMVRGVSDLADENKGAQEVKKWRSYACDVAATYAISLLKNGSVPLFLK